MPKSKLPKRTLKNLDDMFHLDGSPSGITQVKIEELVHFGGGFNRNKTEKGESLNTHPFQLYSGERLEDMVESIKANGVLVPILVRKKTSEEPQESILEILAGHNRTEASKLAGLTEIPALVLEDISDEVALAYVVETNLIQRSFSEMTHSEKAAVIANYHTKMFSQGKRNDIIAQIQAIENCENTDESTSSQIDTKLRTDEKIGEIYNLARATVARYVRINKLYSGLKILLDEGSLPFSAAVEVSFLTERAQQFIYDCISDFGMKISIKQARIMRELHNNHEILTRWKIEDILLCDKSENAPVKPRRVKLNGDVYTRYFADNTPKEVESIVEKALQLYFERERGGKS